MKKQFLLKQKFLFKAHQCARALFLAILFSSFGLTNLSALNVIVKKVVVQQQVTIKGIVTASNNEPLVGVMVVVKGTNTKALTNKSGAFAIKASFEATL